MRSVIGIKWALACIVGLWGNSILLAQESVSFRRDVAPLLREHCLACHGPKKAEGSYRIDHFDALMAVGEGGENPIVPGRLEESGLYLRLVHEDPGLRMPADSDPMDEASIALIKTWIEQGALLDQEEPGDRKKNLLELMPTEVFPLSEQPRGPVPVTAICYSPDSKFLLVGGYHEVDVWNAESWKLEARIGNVMERVHAIQFHPDGKQFIVAGGEPGRLGEVRVFDWEQRAYLSAFGRIGEVVLDVAFQPSGTQVAVAGGDGSLKIFDWLGHRELKSLASHADAVQAVAYSHDGTRLASASRDKTAKVYDSKNFELLATYAEHGGAVRGVLFAPDGQSVYSAGIDKKVHRWNIDGPKRLSDIPGSGELLGGVAQDKWLLFPTSGAKLHLLDGVAGTQVRTLEGPSDWIGACVINQERKQVAAGSFDGKLYVWGLEGGELQSQWKANSR